MTISEIANRNRPFVCLLVALAIVLGALSFVTLPAQEDPKVMVREAIITTRWDNFSPERMESLVTKKIETAVREVPEIEEIRSTTRMGLSIVHAEIYATYDDLDQIWDRLRSKVAQADLPQGAPTPTVDTDFGDVAVMTVAILAEGYENRDIVDIAEYVRNGLYSVAGTKRIDLHGARTETIFIETTNARLNEVGLTIESFSEKLTNENTIRPSGKIDVGDRRFLIEVTGNLNTTSEVGDILLDVPAQAEPVVLRDIADVRRDYIDEFQPTAYYNGESAVVLAIAMHDSERVLDYADRVKSRLTEIEAGLPVGYRVEIVTDQSVEVARAIDAGTLNVFQTLVIVLVIAILFMGVRAGLVIGSIVPISMLLTLAVMGMLSQPLERMSLATFVVALGLLVDNAFVVTDDFQSQLENGADRDSALRNMSRQLLVPLATSTVTTILVFLPLMLAQHQAGEYTRSISIVILIALSVSWLLSMTLTPVLAHRFLTRFRRRTLAERGFVRFEQFYTVILRAALNRRFLTLAVVAALLVAAVYIMTLVPKKFFPDSDRTQVVAYLDLPAGTPLSTTDQRVRRVFDAIDDRDHFGHIESFAGYVGYGGPRFLLSLTPFDAAPNRAVLLFEVDALENMPATIEQLRDMFQIDFPEFRAHVSGMFLGPSDPGLIHAQIKGPDAAYILTKADRLSDILETVPGVIDIWQDWENQVPRFVVDIDRARLQRAKVSADAVAATLSAYFSGAAVSEFRDGDEIFPIIARSNKAERADPARIASLAIIAADGRSVPLSQVADVRLDSGYSVIQRENMLRTVTVEARSTTIPPEDIVARIADEIAVLQDGLSYGHSFEYDGIVKESAEAQQALSANAPYCLAAMALILVAQFASFSRMAAIAISLPLIIIGASVGLVLMRVDFGFMEILGLYALVGILVNNGVLLIDRIDASRDGDGFDAVIAASVQRLRPIAMASGTTIFGLLPLIAYRDPLFFGMASVMAFGLAIGTALVLVVIPVIYTLLVKSPQMQDGTRTRAHDAVSHRAGETYAADPPA